MNKSAPHGIPPLKPSSALLATLLTSLFVLQSISPLYSVPPALNIQGRLTDENGVNRDGNFTMIFAVYSQASGGSDLWKKTYTGIQVRNGNFSVQVGNPNGLDDTSRALDGVFNGSNRWIGISVAGEPELIPRQQLNTVPYAFIAGNGVPSGGIIMWSGTLASIPAGWALCDGNNGTPDLRDRFVLGAAASEDPGGTGGSHSITLTTSQMPQHTHTGVTASSGTHVHQYQYVSYGGTSFMSAGSNVGIQEQAFNTTSGGSHTHTFTTDSTGSGSSVDIRPKYYKLAFIMKL